MAACLPTLLFIWLPWGWVTGDPLGQCFLTAFLQNGGPAGPDFRLYVSSPQEVAESEPGPTLVTVEAPGPAFHQSLSLEPGSTGCVHLPSSVELRGSGVGPGAVQVTSSRPVSVTAVNARPRSLDTALVFPCRLLGRHYTVVTPELQPRDRYKEFAVVAGARGSWVQLRPSCAVTLDGVRRPANRTLDVRLGPYQALQLQSEADLSGTAVSAEHPVAVLAGHSCLRAGPDCEHVCEQLLPAPRWGRVYAVPPFAAPLPGAHRPCDHVYVVAAAEGRLNFWRGGEAGERPLGPGRVLRFAVDWRRPLLLRSSAAVQVLFLAGGGARHGVAYDPWFALVPPVASYGRCYSLTAQPGFSNTALLVAPGGAPAPGTLLLDGRPLTDVHWRPIPCGDRDKDGGFSWAEVAYGAGGGGSHRLETVGDRAFGVLSCGTSDGAGFGTLAARHAVLQPAAAARPGPDLGSSVPVPLLQRETLPLFQLLPQPHPQPGTLLQAGSLTRPHPDPFPHSLSPPPGPPPPPGPSPPSGPPPHPLSLQYPPTCKDYFCPDGTSCRLVKNLPQCVAQGPPVAVAEAVGKPVTITEPESLSGAKPGAISDLIVVARPVGGSMARPVAETLGGSIPGRVVVANPVGGSGSGHQAGQLGAALAEPGMGSLAGSEAQSGLEPMAGSVAESRLGNLGVSVAEPELRSMGATGGQYGLESGGGSPVEPLGVVGGQSGLGTGAGPPGEAQSETEPGPKPVSAGTCWASGVPHFHTFDGRSFAVPGACAYSVCRCPQGIPGAGLPAFHVWAGGDGGRLPLRYVSFHVFGHTITAVRHEYGYVRVDQQRVRLPVTLASGRLRLRYRGTELWAEGQARAVTGPGKGNGAQGKAGAGAAADPWTAPGTATESGAAEEAGGGPGSETWTGPRAAAKKAAASEAWIRTEPRPKATLGSESWAGPDGNSPGTGSKAEAADPRTGSEPGPGAQTGAGVGSRTWTTSDTVTGSRTRLGSRVAFLLIYDWQQALWLKVSGGYRSQVGGLCGNFNGDPADDLSLRQQGTAPVLAPVLAPRIDSMVFASSDSARAFAQAWALEPSSAPCHSQWGPSCILGPEGAGVKTCMLMESPRGPFRNCHQILDPKPFVLSCLEAACAFPGYRPMLCRELETYAHACQREGVSLGFWRPLTNCPRICGPNSHYEPCGSACPVTCADQEGTSPQKCPLPCLETCACNPGFMLSGPNCVARRGPDCGCLLNGLLLGPGEAIWMDTGCRRRCWCPAHGGQVRCHLVGCGPNEHCAVTGGIRGCQARVTTCRVAGDGHFKTFDGQRYRFSGSCSYLLSGLRSPSPGKKQALTPFRVLLNTGPAGIPRGVEVYVPRCHVQVNKGQAGKVLVNGRWRNLPCQVGNRVLIFRRGWDTVVSCPFGLEVAFDGGSHLVLALPRSYAGQVTGLCANYDGDPANDLYPTLGHPPVSDLTGAMALIRSCRVGPTQGCREEVDAKWKGTTVQCKGAISGCHILLAPEGPFRLCHQQVTPQGYFEDCLRDACLIPGRGACPIIQNYAAACQEEGILIYPWRTPDFCRPPCPAHSHYELCGPACPITCGSLSGPAGCQAGRCHEGCVCDPGFVLNGATCVPLGQCGCLLSGHYYEPGLQLPRIWGAPCRAPCICQPGGQVLCPCTFPGTLAPAVSAPGLCLISGGLYCQTFDGTTLRLRGHCSYTLAGTTANCPADLPPFLVEVENEPFRDIVSHIAFTVAGYRFDLDRGDWGHVTVNGIRRCLPFGLPGGGVRAFTQGASMVLMAQGGPRLLLGPGPYLSVTLPAAYHGFTLGLCGNYNGNSADDLKSLDPGPGLQPCPLPQPCPSPGCPMVEEAASAPFQGPNSCGLLRAAQGPFAPCHSTLPPEPFFQNCLTDVIHSQGQHKVLCHFLRSYAAACQEAGARVLPWRSAELCPMSCPRLSHYSLCADPCPADCPGVQAVVRIADQCVEGCQCDPGFFPAAGVCVPLQNCPCFHQGLYFSPGQTVLTDDCSSACSCQPGKGVTCVPHQCPGGQVCSIINGVLRCLGPAYPLGLPVPLTPPLVSGGDPACPLYSRYVPCGPACPATCADPAAPTHCSQPCAPSCQCVPGRLLLAGRCVPSEQCGCLLRPGKAFWTKGCAQHCRCPAAGDPGSPGVQCWPAQCQGHCEEASGDGHHCQPIHLGSGPQRVTCTASGDYRFQTFGGTRFNFPGSCVYRLAGPCSASGSGDLDPFYLDIATHIQPLGCSKSLTLRACDLRLDMSPVDPNFLQVDGILESLPFIHGRCLQAYSCGGHLCLDTASGLSLTYDWDSLVRLSIPWSLAGSLCGLCGGMAGGIPTSQLSRLAHSWKVAEIPGCSPSCGPHCPLPCPATQRGRYRGLGYCGLLGAPAGPMAPCHQILNPEPFLEDCLDEVCQHKGCRRALCRALVAYVTACQAQGVRLRPWRKSSLCPLQCPPHSHYELCGPGCPMTCGDLQGSLGCQAEGQCREGCVCNPGFVLSGATCVPRGRCGCLHMGRYHGLGTTWYPDPGCERRCQCGPGGTVSCGPGACRSHEACSIRRGIRGCFPDGHASCFLAGSRHGLTFDGRALGGLAGQCAYLLARTTDPDPDPFDVRVEKDETGPSQIHLNLYRHQLVLDRGDPGIVKVDGERCRLPLVLPGGHLWVTREGRVVAIQATCGLRLFYDFAQHLRLTVPSTYQGHLSGLCGNFNGDGGMDDFGPRGSLEVFTVSWALPGPGPCSPTGPCPPCPRGLDAAFSGPSACGLLKLPRGPFGLCHNLVPPDPFYGFCLRDMCQDHGGRQGLCNSLTAYTEACQEAGVLVQPWRDPKLCPLKCPPRSHYSICARTCDLGCAPLLGRCSPHCFEGCECDPGFISDGEDCVPQERCGCFRLGRYIPVGESLVLPGCRERCICQVGGRLKCRPFQCPQGLGCVLDRGVRLCRGPPGKGSATCRMVPGGLFTTFDGFQGKVPVLATPGAYELAVLAGANPQDPAWFRVVTEYPPCSACPAPRPWVIIRFRDGCVAVGPNREVWVNGERAQLPAQVCGGVMAQWAGSGKVLVQRPPLLRVLVGPKGAVVLRAARALGGQLEAACGDFNGDPHNDLRLRGGLPATSLDDVFQSCRSQAFGPCMKKMHSPVYNEDYFSP